MNNVVMLGSDRPKPPRARLPPRRGAQILFFTGVRYCRAEDDAPRRPAPDALQASGLALDLAAH